MKRKLREIFGWRANHNSYRMKMKRIWNNPLHDNEEQNTQEMMTYKVQKILNDYANGYELLRGSLTNLSKNELMNLCSQFAQYNDGFAHDMDHQNETDKIIASHEQQIQFLSTELNRLQRYHDTTCTA
eukprot:177713_1